MREVLMILGPLHGRVMETDDRCPAICYAEPVPMPAPWDDIPADPSALLTEDIVTYVIQPGFLFGRRLWFATPDGIPAQPEDAVSALGHPDGQGLYDRARRISYGLPPEQSAMERHHRRRVTGDLMERLDPHRYRQRMPMHACGDTCWYASQGFFQCEAGECVHKGRS